MPKVVLHLNPLRALFRLVSVAALVVAIVPIGNASPVATTSPAALQGTALPADPALPGGPGLTADPLLQANPGHSPDDGTMLPPTRGTAGVTRELQRLRSLPTTTRPLPTTYNKQSFVPRQVTDAQLPYNSTAVHGWDLDVPRDAAGVRMALINGRLYDHPVAQAQDALAALSDYRLTGEARYLTRAAADADRLIARRVVSDDGWYYPYPFDFELHGDSGDIMRAPWFSGMAQGQALSVFVRLYQVTAEAKWLAAADGTYNTFLNAPARDRPYTVHIDSANYLWFEEYPRWPTTASDLTLNGHVFAIWGLFDYQRLTGDPTAVDLWNGGSTHTRWYVQRDFRNLRYISHYCLQHPEALSNLYHQIHIRQMLQMHSQTSDAGWSRIADALRADYPDPEMSGTVALAGGSHTGYKFGSRGNITGSKTINLARSSSAPADRRERILGRGIYLRITAGSLAGYRVLESYPRSVMRGAKVAMTYPLQRVVDFPAGTWSAYRFDAAGTVTGSQTVTLAEPASARFDASAVINGRLHVRLLSGPLATYWVPTANLTLH